MPGPRLAPKRRGFDRDAGGAAEQTARAILREASTSLSSAIAFNRPSARYMTGARTTLKINDQIIGFAFQVTWNVQNQVTQINTIDDIVPWELAPKRVSVSGTLGLFQIPGNSPVQAGIMPDLGSFLANKYITIEVKDSATDALLFKTNTAMITGMQGDINSERLASTTLAWQAVGWQTDSTSAPLKPT